jgi:hypothetical protein
VKTKNVQDKMNSVLTESIIFNAKDMLNKEIHFESITNTIIQHLEKNFDKGDCKIDNILQICINDESIIKEFNTKYGNLCKIINFYQNKLEITNKKLGIASLFISNLEDSLNISNKTIKELNEKINQEKETLRLEYETKISEKRNEMKLKDNEHCNTLNNILSDFNTMKISITGAEIDIKNIQQEYSNLNNKIDNLNCEVYLEDFISLKELFNKRIKINENLKLVMNEVVKVIKEIQTNLQPYSQFMDNLKPLKDLVEKDYFAFYEKETELSLPDLNLILIFLKDIKSIFSDLFENIDLGKLFSYQILDLEKQFYCNVCNKFFPKNNNEKVLECKKHISCGDCYKENTNYFKKNVCFCKLLIIKK